MSYQRIIQSEFEEAASEGRAFCASVTVDVSGGKIEIIVRAPAGEEIVIVSAVASHASNVLSYAGLYSVESTGAAGVTNLLTGGPAYAGSVTGSAAAAGVTIPDVGVLGTSLVTENSGHYYREVVGARVSGTTGFGLSSVSDSGTRSASIVFYIVK